LSNGVIRKIVEDRGFGFVTAEDGTEMFFHSSQCVSRFDDLRSGDAVTFEVTTSAKGPRALQVTLASTPTPVSPPALEDEPQAVA
jgi:CspA family cold shock protein